MSEKTKKVSIINMLVNYKINKIKIELSYETDKKNVQMYLLTNNRDKAYSTNKITPIKDNLNIVYSSFEIDIIPQNIKVIVEENGEIFNTIILDNKNQSILDNEDEYKVYVKKLCVNIKDTEIEIKDKKIFDKLRYEVKKQKYYLVKYHKFCWYRLFKNKPKYYLHLDLRFIKEYI